MIKRIHINLGETTERNCMKTVGQHASFSFTYMDNDSMQFISILIDSLFNIFPLGNHINYEHES